jgi:hypothetical protein
MNNVTHLGSLKERIVYNWMRIRGAIRNYFILIFLLGLLFMGVFFNRIFIFVHPGEAGVIWKMFFGGTQQSPLPGRPASSLALGQAVHLQCPRSAGAA